jgi:hypothetical protein
VKKIVVYYESIKREIKRRPIYECWCDASLKSEGEVSTRRVYTGKRIQGTKKKVITDDDFITAE